MLPCQVLTALMLLFACLQTATLFAADRYETVVGKLTLPRQVAFDPAKEGY
jgi:hypothetical protein